MTTPIEQVQDCKLNTEKTLCTAHRAKPQHLPFSDRRASVSHFDTWAPGTVVIWDNLASQHHAVGDHYPAVRAMDRVTIGSCRWQHRKPKVAAER